MHPQTYPTDRLDDEAHVTTDPLQVRSAPSNRLQRESQALLTAALFHAEASVTEEAPQRQASPRNASTAAR